MKEVLLEKSKELAQELGWSLQQAEGYVDGEAYQRSGLELPNYHKLSMDEYAQGFRTGYFKQACSVSPH